MCMSQVVSSVHRKLLYWKAKVQAEFVHHRSIEFIQVGDNYACVCLCQQDGPLSFIQVTVMERINQTSTDWSADPFIHKVLQTLCVYKTVSTFVMTGCQKKKMVTLCVECSAVAQNQLVSLITSRCPCLADKLWCCNMIVKHCFLKWVFYILSHPLLSVFL